MRYLQPSFTVSTSSGRISQEDYEVAVGLRCPTCRGLWIPGVPHKHDFQDSEKE